MCKYWTDVSKRYDQYIAKLLDLQNQYDGLYYKEKMGNMLPTVENKKINRLLGKIQGIKIKLKDILTKYKQEENFTKQHTMIITRVGYYS